MAVTARRTARPPRKPGRRSPLRIATMEPLDLTQSAAAAAESAAARRDVSWPELRQMMVSEFAEWLRTQTNKHKLPFQEQTITDYAETARVLDRWMTDQKVEGDFTACDTAMLNRFFASSSHWVNIRIDLTGAHLIDLDFSDCSFLSADFSGAWFSKGRVRFNKVSSLKTPCLVAALLK